MPGLLAADALEQLAWDRGTAGQMPSSRGTLDLSGASVSEVAEALSLAFAVSVVYTDALGDHEGPDRFELASVDLPRALRALGGAFGVDARRTGALVVIRPTEPSAEVPAPVADGHNARQGCRPAAGRRFDRGSARGVDNVGVYDVVRVDGDAAAADISELVRLCHLLETEKSIIGP
jgi:hypothetical protein